VLSGVARIALLQKTSLNARFPTPDALREEFDEIAT